MQNFHHSMTINAPIKQLFSACSTESGLRAWWTQDCDAGSQVGDQIVVRFGSTSKTMQIDRLVPSSEIRWHVTKAYLDVTHLRKKDEWKGTTICILLHSESATQTHLTLEHVGLNSGVECYGICSDGWIQFLNSLKAFVETGYGSPYQHRFISKINE